MLEIIVSCIISSLISVIFSNEIISFVRRALIRVGFLKNFDLTGDWEATFFMNGNEAFREIIQIKHNAFTVNGYIKNDSRNYERLKTVMKKNPRRITAQVNDNTFITGFWYHPIEINRHHGSFQMIISFDGKEMDGQWIGFSETGKVIDHGIWKWNKLDDD